MKYLVLALTITCASCTYAPTRYSTYIEGGNTAPVYHTPATVGYYAHPRRSYYHPQVELHSHHWGSVDRWHAANTSRP